MPTVGKRYRMPNQRVFCDGGATSSMKGPGGRVLKSVRFSPEELRLLSVLTNCSFGAQLQMSSSWPKRQMQYAHMHGADTVLGPLGIGGSGWPAYSLRRHCDAGSCFVQLVHPQNRVYFPYCCRSTRQQVSSMSGVLSLGMPRFPLARCDGGRAGRLEQAGWHRLQFAQQCCSARGSSSQDSS